MAITMASVQPPFEINRRAAALAENLCESPGVYRVKVRQETARVIDAGCHAVGGISTGCLVAEICMGGLGTVSVAPSQPAGVADSPRGTGFDVVVATDHPLAACMASQYAGWQISHGSYFAMGSGPMRAAGSSEPLFNIIGHREQPAMAVGVLESAKLPPAEVAEQIARSCEIEAAKLTLVVAPTASLVGTIQVVARSVETALHKLHEIGFDLAAVVSGAGSAPLPPIAGDDLTAIGWTNDAILYGGRVTLWVDCRDAEIEKHGPQVPSSASRDHGRPFAEVFRQYDGDFYKIDPLLFSPAEVTFCNLRSGRTWNFGRVDHGVLAQSLGGNS